jgi:hypothetical protein
MAVEKKRKRGRPAKPEEDKKQTVTVSLRMEPGLHERLKNDAEMQGKSANKEMADRLERTLSQGGYIDHSVFGERQTHNLMRLIGMMVRNLHLSEGDEIWEHPDTHQELKDAVSTVLDAFGPNGGIPREFDEESAGQRRARLWLNRIKEAKNAPPIKSEYESHNQDEFALEVILDCLGEKLTDKLEITNE